MRDIPTLCSPSFQAILPVWRIYDTEHFVMDGQGDKKTLCSPSFQPIPLSSIYGSILDQFTNLIAALNKINLN